MEWLRKVLTAMALTVGVVGSVATSRAGDELAVQPTVMGESTSESFGLIGNVELVRTGTVRYETVGALSATLNVSLEVQTGADVADVEIVVIHGIHADTAETLEARLDEGSTTVVVRGNVTLECDGTRDTCVHDEPFLIRINRLDGVDADVTARLRVGGSIELADQAGPSAQDSVVVEIDTTG